MLEVDKVHTYYGTSHILFDVSLSVDRGEIVCLLGRNGAGKTTTLRTLMGLTPCKSGSIKFHGQEIKSRPPYYIARLGMGYVPDNRLVFPDLTVRENLELAIKVPKKFSGEPWSVERVYELFPSLKKLDRNLGGYLSGGEQQMLTVGRTLMGNPELILLDEPVEGLAPLVVREFASRIRSLRTLGQTILFSEQNLAFALAVAQRAYVIDRGRIRFQGSMEELGANEEVKRKYLMV
ncbi:MAG: ABC transporter ATP-binding protein [Proteobacteria bacterium]|nr:ABC transporter ATP-binding protein [Pseudomonadota bacterium]MBU1451345.1 ABC transporter ATP-binding protein [Pseudomonadota bacterium]MBU2469534.1 ABC transporter ATP-binding protein [Pseudomonadota bacterium]MBU2518391.1 ABC transporter ATP-binding protein [Pseudomonadota bacterium]